MTGTIEGVAKASSDRAEALLELIDVRSSGTVLESTTSLGDAEVRIGKDSVLPFFTILKRDSQLDFSMFLDVTAIDWMDDKEERFELVYHLRSFSLGHFLRVRVWVPEDDATVSSVVSLWAGADFLEREVWDMYGISFADHPDLTRILMYPEFKGFPLRKDYPLQGKQPRIPLRAPEVENTALMMKRPDLIGINKRPLNQSPKNGSSAS